MLSIIQQARDWSLSGATAVGVFADRTARHVNLYRVASYTVSQHTTDGTSYFGDADFYNGVLGRFDTYDQDRHRPDEERKLQLARCGTGTATKVCELLRLAQSKDTNNLALLHQIHRTRSIILGPDKSADESIRYARRASRKLHPDRNQDLNGWHIPGTRYWKTLPAGYRSEHARHGAAALFLLHNNLKELLAKEHYRRLLFSAPVQRGGRLSIAEAASDLTLATAIGALFGIVKQKSIHFLLIGSASAYAALLLVYLAKLIQSRHTGRQNESCRDMVIYQPLNILPQGTN